MTERKAAVFFCSASGDIKSEYNQAAREIVRAACLSGYGIVSGGTVKGTMWHISDEASRYGVEVVGVVPRFMKGLEHPSLTRCIWTDRMSERKDAMREEGASLAIGLPGGIGTLDELAETYCLAKMGLYPGRVAAFNMDGFYEPLRRQLDLYVERGFLDTESRALISFPETLEELKKLL